MRFSKYSDEELVRYIQKNNGQGFEEIIERYQKKLLRYALNLCRDSETAEDIVQDTFIASYQNINGFNVKRKFSPWIYRIAHNKAINELRKAKRTTSINDISELPSPEDLNQIEEKLDNKKSKKILINDIASLPLKYQEVIILRFFEDKNYEEISDILKIPRNTVGVRIKRGLERLRKDTKINIKDIL